MKSEPEPLLLIVDPEREEPTDWCFGPDAAGRCPRQGDARLVPCAGRTLCAAGGDLSPMSMRMVSELEDECPLPILVAGGG